MNDQQLIIVVAKLDGRNINWDMDTELFYTINDRTRTTIETPPYITCRDAIIPVIEKVYSKDADTRKQFTAALNCELFPMGGDYMSIDLNEVLWMIIHATPKQLAIALAKACGKWEE